MTLVTQPVVALAVMMLGAPAEPGKSAIEVKVTHRYLVPLCLNGTSIRGGERRWRLEPREHVLALTMENDPHAAAERHQKAAEPKWASGVATVRFTPEKGHRYEIEVRAPALAFSRRVWEPGDWKPVVRDRTVDRIVSSEPEWNDSACRP
jgi:hypothetical protein